MRTFRPALGALVVLLLLIFCADSEAGRHCRRQRCGNDCCGIPCWVRWFDSHDYSTCPAGYDCYCCSGTTVINCNSGTSNCSDNTVCCVKQGGPPPSCGGLYGSRGCAGQGCTTGCRRLYAMVYDSCCHVLRFALPCECPDVYGPLWMLGVPPAPHSN